MNQASDLPGWEKERDALQRKLAWAVLASRGLHLHEFWHKLVQKGSLCNAMLFLYTSQQPKGNCVFPMEGGDAGIKRGL